MMKLSELYKIYKIIEIEWFDKKNPVGLEGKSFSENRGVRPKNAFKTHKGGEDTISLLYVEQIAKPFP